MKKDISRCEARLQNSRYVESKQCYPSGRRPKSSIYSCMYAKGQTRLNPPDDSLEKVYKEIPGIFYAVAILRALSRFLLHLVWISKGFVCSGSVVTRKGILVT